MGSLFGTGAWEYKTPPGGLSALWWFFALVAVGALCADTWCVLRCRGAVRWWMLLMLAPVFLSSYGLGNVAGLDWAYRHRHGF